MTKDDGQTKGKGRMNTRALNVLFLVLVVATSACAPTGPTGTPQVIPTKTAPAATGPLVTRPLTTPAATLPVVRSESAPLPVVIAQVDLGMRFEQPLQHAVALDTEGRRLFIGAPPDKTLVLSADNLSLVDTLALGGGVAVDGLRKRLFVGAPSGVAVFNLGTLQLAGTIPIAASSFGSTPIVDESTGDVIVVYQGAHIVNPVTLQVTEHISGTSPAFGETAPNPFAVDAALDAQRRLLYISLNNGIPGSNNGNTLTVHDLKSGARVYEDGERSIVSLQADESSGRLFLTRSRMNAHSLSVLTSEASAVKTAWRVNGITGWVQVDAQRGRVYVADSWAPSPHLSVLDATTGALMADVPLPRPCTLAAFDAEANRLYFVSADGYLTVMGGHGADMPAPQEFVAAGVLSGTVTWIAPSPNLANDRMVFAAWAPGGYASGPLGSLAGQLLASTDGGSTWGRVRGGLPTFLLVNTLALSPDYARDRTVFAALVSPSGRGGGIYVSNDAGRSWRPASRGLDDWTVAEMAVAPGFPLNKTMFALTRQSGLFRSSDGGQTWERTGYRASVPAAMNSRSLAISPSFISDKTLVVSAGDSTSISRDGGENWWPLIGSRATAMAFSPDYSRDHAMLGSFADVGVLRSDDGGAMWRAASRGLRLEAGTRPVLALSPDFPRDRTAFVLFSSYERSALYRTTDGSATWQIESGGWAGKAQITALAVSPDYPRDGLLFLGLNDGRLRPVKVSDLKWSNAPAALDKLNVEAIAVSPNYANDQTVLIGGGRSGVFVSTDGGKGWQETSFPARDIGTSRVRIALSPGYAGDRIVFAAAGGQMFRSNDGGATWQWLSGLGSFFPVSDLALSPQFASDQTALVGGGYAAPRVMRSTDAGQTWNAASGLGPNSGISALAFTPDSRVAYAWAGESGLYRTGDGGATWSRVFSPTISAAEGWMLQSLAVSPDLVRDRLMFAGFVGPQNLRRSADGGATWYPSLNGLPPGLTWGSALALSPDFAHDRLMFLGTDKGVFRSDDGGMTWKASSVGLPPSGAGVLSLAISPSFTSDHTIFTGLVERGLYVSMDAGATWRPAR